MKDVLFIHSAGPQGETEGSGPLVAALRAGLGPGIRVAAPIMPEPDDPRGAAWDAAFADHVRNMLARFVLVGHSLGASVILKYLAEHDAPQGLAGVITIAAPFWGNQDWEKEFRLPKSFARRLCRVPIALFHSRDDDIISFAQLERYAAALPEARVHAVDGRGHAFDNGNVADIVAAIRKALGD